MNRASIHAGLIVGVLLAASFAVAQTPFEQPKRDPRDLNGVYMTTSGPGAGGGGMAAGPGATPGGASDPAGGAGLAMPPTQASGGLPAGMPPMGDTPRMRCIPQFQVGFAPYAGQIIQTPGRVTIITEFNHMVRRVYLDESFPARMQPSYMGYSIGHWSGNTLMVETRGLKAGGNGFGVMTEGSRVMERFTRSEDGTVLQEATIVTPDAQGRSTITQQSAVNAYRPDLHLMEFICEDGADDFYSNAVAN